MPTRVIYAEAIINEQLPPSTLSPQEDVVLDGAGTAYVEDDGAFDIIEKSEERPKASSDGSLENASTAELLQNEDHASTSPSDPVAVHLTPQGSTDSTSISESSTTKADENLDSESTDTMEPIGSPEISSGSSAPADGEVRTAQEEIPKDEETFPAAMDGEGVARTRSNLNAEEGRQSELADAVLEEPSHEEENQLDMSGEPVFTVGNELQLLVALPDR